MNMFFCQMFKATGFPIIRWIFIILIAIWVKPGSSLFSWHPILMALAYVCFMLEGIYVLCKQEIRVYKGFEVGTMTFMQYTQYFCFSKYYIKINIHAFWQTVASICSGIGFGIIYYNKWENGKQHFTTWHGLSGLIVILLTVTNLVGGIVLKYLRILVNLMPCRLGLEISLTRYYQSIIKAFHGLSAIVIINVSCITLFLISYSNWIQQFNNLQSSFIQKLAPITFIIFPIMTIVLFNLAFGAKFINDYVFKSNNILIESIRAIRKLKA